jgi:hypothetical protein
LGAGIKTECEAGPMADAIALSEGISWPLDAVRMRILDAKETPRIKKVDLGNVNNDIRHCEEPLRRSNPGATCCGPWIASLRSQ